MALPQGYTTLTVVDGSQTLTDAGGFAPVAFAAVGPQDPYVGDDGAAPILEGTPGEALVRVNTEAVVDIAAHFQFQTDIAGTITSMLTVEGVPDPTTRQSYPVTGEPQRFALETRLSIPGGRVQLQWAAAGRDLEVSSMFGSLLATIVDYTPTP